MSHTSRAMAEARNNAGGHNGTKAEILAALKLHGPLSRNRLCLETGLRFETVTAALGDMVTDGGVVAMSGYARVGRQHKVYALYAPPKVEPRQKGEFAVAGRITIPQFRWHGIRHA